MTIHYEKLHAKNFNTYSLDHFVRHQRVSECWRNVEGQWKLIPIEFERGRQADSNGYCIASRHLRLLCSGKCRRKNCIGQKN